MMRIETTEFVKARWSRLTAHATEQNVKGYGRVRVMQFNVEQDENYVAHAQKMSNQTAEVQLQSVCQNRENGDSQDTGGKRRRQPERTGLVGTSGLEHLGVSANLDTAGFAEGYGHTGERAGESGTV